MSEENKKLKSFANEQDAQEWMFNVEIEDENCIHSEETKRSMKFFLQKFISFLVFFSISMP